MRSILLACALLVALTAAAWADGNTGLIYGRVLQTETGTPACPISVMASSDRQPPDVVVSNRDGSFHFLSIVPGPVTLTVGSVSRDVVVSANIVNMDAYVRPIYITQRHIGILVRSNRHFISHTIRC